MQRLERQSGTEVVIDVDRRWGSGALNVPLWQVVRDVADRGMKSILINSSEVDSMDSLGIGEFVAGFAVAESRGLQLQPLHANSCLRDILQSTQLISLFDSYEEESAGAASCGGGFRSRHRGAARRRFGVSAGPPSHHVSISYGL